MLERRIGKPRNRLDEEVNLFFLGKAGDAERDRAVQRQPQRASCRFAVAGREFLRVDPVVKHADPFRSNAEPGHEEVPQFFAHGNDEIDEMERFPAFRVASPRIPRPAKHVRGW